MKRRINEKHLGAQSKKKLRTLAENTYNRKFHDIQQIAKFLGVSKTEAWESLAKSYNKSVDSERKNKKIFEEAKKYTPELVTSAYKSYNVFKYKSNDDWIIKKMKRITKGEGYIEMKRKDVEKYANDLAKYNSLIIQTQLKQKKSLRVYAVIKFKEYKEKTKSIHEFSENLGRADITSLKDYKKYLIDGILSLIHI